MTFCFFLTIYPTHSRPAVSKKLRLHTPVFIDLSVSVGFLPVLLPCTHYASVWRTCLLPRGGLLNHCNMSECLREDFNEKSSSELEHCSLKERMAIMRRSWLFHFHFTTSMRRNPFQFPGPLFDCSYFCIFSVLSCFPSVPQWSVKSHGGLKPSTSPQKAFSPLSDPHVGGKKKVL